MPPSAACIQNLGWLNTSFGKEGDQTVFHFHMHVVPRHAGDGITRSWPRKDPPREVLQAHALRLRKALKG